MTTHAERRASRALRLTLLAGVGLLFVAPLPGQEAYLVNRTVFSDAALYLNFEETAGRGICDAVRGAPGLTEDGTVAIETAAPIQGAKSLDSNNAGACRTTAWTAAPWNDSASNWTYAHLFQLDSTTDVNDWI